jgi:CII-binding regulator of phage lambda lysogenization HflD
MKSDLDAQHKGTELKEVGFKVLELEVELENKNQCCDELETRCLELQLQVERYEPSSNICYANIIF